MMTEKITFLLFGATGDLAVKKIFPALEKISQEIDLSVIALSRRDWNDADFKAYLGEENPQLSQEFVQGISYSKIDIEKSAGYEALAEKLEDTAHSGELLVYFSLAPQLHAPAFRSLVGAGVLSRGKGKLLIEKPFGTDEKSAKALDALIASKLERDQLYRIDHYLGKETLIAFMDLHEKTPDLGKMISREGVSSLRFRLSETQGINGRGDSYDKVGAFRDVGQNHMLEMLAIAAADLSTGISWQEARANAIELLSPPAKTCDLSRRGQYEGYLLEKGVGSNSQTETAFEIVTSFSKGKLKGVPIILESGKKLGSSEAFAEIAFKDVPGLPKRMTFSIQPEQKIVIEYVDGKTDIHEIPKKKDAYENIILAAIRGSDREFVGEKEIEALWRYADKVVACWNVVSLERYSLEKPFKFGTFASF